MSLSVSTSTLTALSSSDASLSTLNAKITKKVDSREKADNLAQEYEGVFLKTLLERMFEGLKGEGPMGGKDNAQNTWRSFLVDEYAKNLTAQGGIGLAPQLSRELLRLQESAS